MFDEAIDLEGTMRFITSQVPALRKIRSGSSSI